MLVEKYHIPVLLEESIEGLNIDSDGIYVDATYGNGGHSTEILKKLSKRGKLIAFDMDAESEKYVLDDDRLIYINHNYKYISNYLDYLGIRKVNGFLLDLGISSNHIDIKERGFSYRYDDAPLDMRMDRNIG